MSSTSVDSSPNTSHVHLSERPLIVAAYRYGASSRKRRVKVPPNISWMDFLGLFYSRLNISPDFDIEIYDEKGIEIVSVEDLVENDVLVVKERLVKKGAARMDQDTPPLMVPHAQFQLDESSTLIAKAATASSYDQDSFPLGVPHLSHFIQSNSFGFYFLAEVENIRLLPTQGKVRKTHCIVKVPHNEKAMGTFQTFESEANLLRKISGHKCVISPPVVQILNFSDESLRRFYSSISRQKQMLLQQLFMSGGCTEAYVYPLYGVTMATRIKKGLTPDKVLKYSYQLADIMYFLQQRGVIHQNLLPENIQVMSNDRVMVCNFETAIQTDPTTCLLVVSRSVVAPSNRKGLSPEVISAFARLKIDTETVDYSTQYPWSFAVLSIIMATGQHPLKDYPLAYEISGRVKYRSHSYQALPDPEQYPSIFCKVVKRSLSCDPVRRPTLPQILSVIKKDAKILTMMSDRSSSAAGTRPRTSEPKGAGYDPAEAMAMESQVDDHLYSHPKPRTARLLTHPSSKGFCHTHPPLPPPPLGRRFSSADVPSEQFHNQASSKSARVTRRSSGGYPEYSYHTASKRNRDDHMTSQEGHMIHFDSHMASHDSHMISHDLQMASHMRSDSRPKHNTFMPPEASISPHSNEPWHGFSDEGMISFYPPSRYRKATSREENDTESFPMRRHDSQGAFTDDFVTSPKQPSNQYLPLDTAQTRSRFSENRVAVLARSSYTSENDLSPCQDIQYRRLSPSPNGGSSGEPSPSFHQSASDQERLIRPSSSEFEQDFGGDVQELAGSLGLGGIASRVQKRPTPEEATAVNNSPHDEGRLDDVTLGMPRAKVSRTLSYKVPTNNSRVGRRSPVVRRCFSDGESDLEGPKKKKSSGTSSDVGVTHRYGGAEMQAERQPVGTYIEGQRGGQGSGANGMFSDSYSPSEKLRNLQEHAPDSHADPDSSHMTSHAGVQQTRSRDGFQARSQEVQERSGNAAACNEGESSLSERGDLFSALANKRADQFLTANQQFWSELVSSSASKRESKPGQYLFSLDNSLSGSGDLSSHTNAQRHMTSDQLQSFELPTTTTTSRDETSTRIGNEENHQSASEMRATQEPTVTTTIPHFDAFPEALSGGLSQVPMLSNEAMQDEPMSPEELSQRLTDTAEGMETNTTNYSTEVTFGDKTFQPAQAGRYQPSSTAVASIGAHSLNTAAPSWFHGNQTARYDMGQVANQHRPPEPGAHSDQTSGNILPARQVHHQSGYSAAGYSIMSPIPEASQECSSQTNTTAEQLNSSQIHSASPMDQTHQRSVSPFRHSVLSDRDSSPSTAITALRTNQFSDARASTPQLDPLSSDTSSHSRRSHSMSVDGSVTSSAQAQVSDNTGRAITEGTTTVGATTARPTTTAERPTTAVATNEGATSNRERMPLSTTPERQTALQSGTRRQVGSRSEPSSRALSPQSGASGYLSPLNNSSRSGTPSNQRLSDYPLSGHRISQDMEVFNLAISGMDSLRQQEYTSQAMQGGSQQYASYSQQAMSPQSQPHPPHHRQNIELSRSFRPITPSVSAQSRSVSAAPTLQSASVGTEPAARQLTPDRQLSGTGVTADHHSGPLPPQVSADSYDYLPPYSPPRESQLVQERQLSNPPLYPEPPPSYEEIFGRHRHRHRQHGYSPRNGYGSQRSGGGGGGGGGGGQSSSRQLTRQSSNQRRLSSLTNLFRRTRRHSQDTSSSSRSRQQQQRSEQPSPDTNEYTARWVASYSHTPRPTDHVDFRGGDSLSVVSTGSTALQSHAPSLTSHTMSDTTPSHSRREGQPPVPYRHPPPFPSAENIPQLTEHSVVPLNSRNAQPQASTQTSVASTSTVTHTSYSRQPRGYHGNRPGRFTRSESSHDQQRPFSTILSSDAVPPNVDISQLTIEHSQSSTNMDIGQHRTTNRNRRERLSNLVMCTGISTSCFDILSAPEGQQRGRQVHSAARGREVRSRGRPSSMVQRGPTGMPTVDPVLVGGSQPTNSNVAANANANNINTDNVTASPRTSNTSSPDNPVNGAPNTSNSVRTNARMRAASRRNQHAAQHSSSDEETSEQQTLSQQESRVRVRRRRSQSGSTRSGGQRSQLSQEPAADGGEEFSQRLTSESSRVPDVGLTQPSNEEIAPAPDIEHDSQTVPHQHTTCSHNQEVNQSEPNQSEPNQAEENQPEETQAVPQEQEEDGSTAIRSEEEVTSCGRQETEGEIQTVELALDSPGVSSEQTDLGPPGSGKPCGHPCVVEEQELCCLCTKNLQEEISRVTQNCLLCERRTAAEDELGEVPCSCHGNKISSSCAVHSRSQRSSLQQQRKGGRNCTVM